MNKFNSRPSIKHETISKYRLNTMSGLKIRSLTVNIFLFNPLTILNLNPPILNHPVVLYSICKIQNENFYVIFWIYYPAVAGTILRNATIQFDI